MGYPIGIVIKTLVREIFLLKFMIGIEDGFDMIAVFNSVKPCEHILLKIFYALVIRLMLHIKNRWQVALLQFYLIEKMLSLFASRRLGAIEMVCTANKTVFASLIEIILKSLVNHGGTLSSLDNDKAHRGLVDHGITQSLPVDGALIMRNVDALDFVTRRIVGIAIKGSPAKTSRSDKEIIEHSRISSKYQKNSHTPFGRRKLQMQ